MDLMHNTAFRILVGPHTGTYRVILDEIQIGKTAVVRLDPPSDEDKPRGGRKRLENPKKPRKKPRPPLIGALIWMDSAELHGLKDGEEIITVEIEPENFSLSEASQMLYETRKKVMARFFDFDHFREEILIHGTIAGLVKEAVTVGASKSAVYANFSLLARFGFMESSLRPMLFRCGAPNVPKPCDSGGRKKAGAKTKKQRIAKAHGILLEPEQPGMSTEWRRLILAADKHIPTPKPPMPARCTQIIDSGFVRRFKHVDGKLVPIPPSHGEYPNRRQIQRVLEKEISRLQRLLDQTTKGHFKRSMRGLISRSWKGVAGPGHTWAIDSTIGDIYLRSSVNRAWIIGRPIVYIIVDVWSTAIVGFYVCLQGPSWDMAKMSLFCSAAPPELIAELWGYEPMLSLSPAPTMCAALMCDRGEYLSKAASITGAKLIPCLSYAPPYRPDLKGLVEVLHRIKKDRQYHFIPGAIDQRRVEFELRRFDPNEAVLTVREYVAYLYTIFTEYNLTAPRHHRLDAHMHAASVFPSPAGLWRWGHEMGIGVRRNLPLSELITNLLPAEDARVTRQGVMFAGKNYLSDIIDEQQWTAHARNFGGWDISAHYFPGSVSRIWTKNPGASGLLDLHLSDYSTASPELTFDEVLDALAYSQLNTAEVEHTKISIALQARQRVMEIIGKAKELTAEALDKDRGTKPTLSVARQFESMAISQPNIEPVTEATIDDPGRAAHQTMMKALFAAANSAGGQNE